MNYVSMKLKEAMQKITQNEIYLPAIQRKFVWGPDRIENLFDSIMRGYPIGTFLFWFVKAGAKDNYTFYKFIQDFHERDRPWNELAPKPDLRDEFIGVLDGQQRLNSMYVALQGSHASRRKHGRWIDDNAFPQRFLYIDLFYEPHQEEENDVEYEFSFLTIDAAQAQTESGEKFWFRVKDVIGWDTTGPIYKVITEAVSKFPQFENKLQAKCGPLLNLLWQRLCTDDVISYFSIKDQELDKVTDIFVRVNSAGVQLSKTDLLFSSIVAHWDSGRDEIEKLIVTLNAKGAGFAFNNDFIMRSCLVLADLPIRLKVNSFKHENIERIKSTWPNIKRALEEAVDLLVEWGVCGTTLPAANAVIPIAYFMLKGGDLQISKMALRQYLIRSQINQVFGSGTDSILSAIRENMRTGDATELASFRLKEQILTVQELVGMKLPKARTFQITEEDIDELLNASKGPYTFLVLSLLYPQLKFNQVQFHQDHIHPDSQFSTTKLKAKGVPETEIPQWQALKDKLPNLQLMEGLENQSKNSTPFSEWLKKQAHGDYFIEQNIIPDQGFEISNFGKFFEARKELLRERLREQFGA